MFKIDTEFIQRLIAQLCGITGVFMIICINDKDFYKNWLWFYVLSFILSNIIMALFEEVKKSVR